VRKVKRLGDRCKEGKKDWETGVKKAKILGDRCK
jgi:hypothetical protein